MYAKRIGRDDINADVCGAANIWNVAVKGELLPSTTTTTTARLSSSSRVMANPLVLRWDYARWK
jgi:hypothetical protein